MEFHVFTDLFNRIDAVTATFATDVSKNIMTSITPIVSVGLTLSFMCYGLLIIYQMVEQPIMDFLLRSVKVAVISAIALTAGLYQDNIAEIIQKTPDQLATLLMTSDKQDQKASDLLDSAAGAVMQIVGDGFEKSGIFTNQGLVLVFCSVIIMFSAGILLSIGGALILLAKVALSILAALGPLFIASLLFKTTSRFFEIWMNQIITYGLMTVIFAAIFGLLISILKTYTEGLIFDGVTHIAGAVLGCVIFCISSIVIMVHLPGIAAGLSGGIGLTGWNDSKAAAGIGTKSVREGSKNAAKNISRKAVGYFRGKYTKVS